MSAKQPIDHVRPSSSKKLPGSKPLSSSRIERNGIKPGSIAPDFTMPDLNGRTISLQQYRGGRLVLIFSDPHCGPCNQLAPYLTRMYQRCGATKTEIVVVSRGEIEENREKAETYRFNFPVLVQDRWKLSRKYGIFATPVAFLIDENGRTEREVAIGFEQIRNLLRDEFTPRPIERFKETIEDISGVLSSPLPRRQAIRIAALMAATAFLSVIGVPETALAACGSGFTACGTACCDSAQICCNAATNTCCSTSLVCCNGVCCAPGQVCLFGACHQQILP